MSYLCHTLLIDRCSSLSSYGAAIDSLPAPEVDIKGFAAGIKSLNEHGAQRVWDPKTQQMRPWVDAHSLKRYYPLPSEGKCSIM